MLAMHDTDYDLPKGRSVTVRRAVDVNMLDFDSAVAIMDAGYADAKEAMPQILERVSERWSPERYAERREEFRANGRRCGSATISWRGWPKRRSLISATS